MSVDLYLKLTQCIKFKGTASETMTKLEAVARKMNTDDHTLI